MSKGPPVRTHKGVNTWSGDGTCIEWARSSHAAQEEREQSSPHLGQGALVTTPQLSVSASNSSCTLALNPLPGPAEDAMLSWLHVQRSITLA